MIESNVAATDILMDRRAHSLSAIVLCYQLLRTSIGNGLNFEMTGGEPELDLISARVQDAAVQAMGRPGVLADGVVTADSVSHGGVKLTPYFRLSVKCVRLC